MKYAPLIPLALLAAALVALGVWMAVLGPQGMFGSGGVGAAADSIDEVGIDMNPAGNTAGSLGTIETCIQKFSDDPKFDIDIYIKDLPADSPVPAFEGYLHFPDAIVSVQAADGTMFLDQYPDSIVFDMTAGLPWTTSPGLLSVSDTGAYPETSETGSGVLDRVTLHIVGPGVGTLSLEGWLVYGNGDPDAVYPITTVASAQIAVDEPCPEATPTPTPPPDDDSDGDGFTDTAELYIGTDPLDACADTATPNDEADDKWPLDQDDNQKADTGDVLRYAGLVAPPTSVPPGPQRLDLDLSSTIDTGDVLMYAGMAAPPTYCST